jgi:hypothetical protein
MYDDKPPKPRQVVKKPINDHFVFNNIKSSSIVYPFQGGPVNRSENSFNNLNSSKPQTENSKVTHLEGDHDILDLDSSTSVKSLDNPEIISGPA